MPCRGHAASSKSYNVNSAESVWRRPKLYVADFRRGSGGAVNGDDVHTFFATFLNEVQQAGGGGEVQVQHPYRRGRTRGEGGI